MAQKHTARSLQRAADKGERLVGVTAYTHPMARFAEEAGIDLILVGDSVGMVELGYPDTLPVTMDEMIHHCRAVRRGAPQTFVVGDMPFMSYQVSDEEAVRNAGRFVKEGGCDAVKVEWCATAPRRVRAITEAGMLVMGHVGFTPQRTAQLGGYRVQGRGDARRHVVEQALALQEAGAFCILIEMATTETGRAVTEAVDVFTVGVGAGDHPHMQLVVMNDLLGLFREFKPRYVKRYAELADVITDALKRYAEDVRERRFPSEENFYE